MILEYKLEMSPGGMKCPDWVEDGGYFVNGNRYIGWTRDNPEWHIPSTVTVSYTHLTLPTNREV